MSKQVILDGKESTGSSNAYVVWIDGPGYYDGQTIRFTANHANSGASTLSVSGKTAIAIKKRNDIALVSGDIEAGQIVLVSYNESDNVFELLSEIANTVSTSDIEDNAITSSKIEDNAITSSKIEDNAITSSKIDEGVLQVSTITITSAEILALNATPKELVAAPGAGKVVIVDKVIATVDYTTTAYTTNTTLEVRYGTATTKVTADITGLLTATADKSVSVGGIEAELVNAINDNIEINVATGEALAGDSDIKVTVLYRVLSV